MSSGSAISRAGHSSVDSLLASISASVSKEFRRNCESKDTEIQRLADLLAESEAVCRELNSSLTERETCIIRLEDALEKADESRRTADEARKEARSERDDAKQDRDDAKGQRDDAKKERDFAHRNLDRATASYESLKIELENVRAERNSAVKMLHQSQLETEDWKKEAEKREIEVACLQRELAHWKEQAQDAEKRILAVDEERRSKIADVLRELQAIRNATNPGLYNYQSRETKIEDQQHFAPLTPASPSSRHADLDDNDNSSPSPVRTRGRKAGNEQQNATVSGPSINSHATIFASSSHRHTAVAKTSKGLKTPKAESSTASASTSMSTMKSKSKLKAVLPIASEHDSRNPSHAHSSVAPLLYPDPEPEETTSTSNPSSSSASKFRSITRTRLLCRVNEHQFSIKADEDQNGDEIKSEPEDDDDAQQLDQLASKEGEAIDMDEGQEGPSDPHPRFQYVVRGFGHASLRPGHSQMISYAPAREERSKSAWDLFSEDEQENAQQVAGPSRIEESSLKSRRKLPSQPTKQPARSKPRHVGDEEVAEDDEEEQHERRRRLTTVKQRPRRKRSPSVSSETSSADELMITGSVPPSPRTCRTAYAAHPSSNSKKRAHTLMGEGVSREEDQGGKRRRKQ